MASQDRDLKHDVYDELRDLVDMLDYTGVRICEDEQGKNEGHNFRRNIISRGLDGKVESESIIEVQFSTRGHTDTEFCKITYMVKDGAGTGVIWIGASHTSPAHNYKKSMAYIECSNKLISILVRQQFPTKN